MAPTFLQRPVGRIAEAIGSAGWRSSSYAFSWPQLQQQVAVAASQLGGGLGAA
jgi:hypothetical protein